MWTTKRGVGFHVPSPRAAAYLVLVCSLHVPLVSAGSTRTRTRPQPPTNAAAANNGGSAGSSLQTTLNSNYGSPNVPPPNPLVSVNLRFFKLLDLDESSATMSVLVWLRMSWTDERLTWDPNSNNVTKLWMDPTTVWTPDAVTYNRKGRLEETFDRANVMVTPDGSAYWSRPGTLELSCMWSGLVNFPFDRLGCRAELGGWMMSGWYQYIVPDGEGYTLDRSEFTALSSYQAMALHSISCNLTAYEYPCCPGEPWPVLSYYIEVQRTSAFPYMVLAVLPMCLLTLASFAVFGMSRELDARLAYSITLILALEVGQSSYSDLIPKCNELLWIQLYSITCYVFCYMSLLETVIVVYVASCRSEYLIMPNWLSEFVYGTPADRLRAELKALEGEYSSPGGVSNTLSGAGGKRPVDTMTGDRESCAHLLWRYCASGPNSHSPHPPTHLTLLPPGRYYNHHATTTGVNQNQQCSSPPPSPPESASAAAPAPGDCGRGDSSGASGPPRKHRLAGVARALRATSGPKSPFGKPNAMQGRVLSDDDNRRLLFFERIFFDFDVSHDGVLQLEEAKRALAFLAYRMKPLERIRTVSAIDNGDGVLSRLEWVEMCVRCFPEDKYSMEHLRECADTFVMCTKAEGEQGRARWRRTAEKIDYYARRYIVLLFFLCLCVISQTHLNDPYNVVSAPSDANTNYWWVREGSFYGIWSAELRDDTS